MFYISYRLSPACQACSNHPISLLKRGDRLYVVVPVYRTSQMGVMTVRSEAELAALKTKVL